MIIVILTMVISFLLGAIPFGYLITKRMCNVDIRTKGSGNIGSTNVKRVAGTKVSTITQVFDILKGVIPVAASIIIAHFISLPISSEAYIALTAVVSILGHDYTPFLNFNGGKGVNTTLGAFVLIAPIPTFSGVIVHCILKYVTNIVSIRSIVLGFVIPIMCFILGYSTEVILATSFAALLIVLRHKENIKRLIRKEEN